MERTRLKGKVQTVLGLIEPDDLGIVLPHEHFFIDLRCNFVEPSEPEDKELITPTSVLRQNELLPNWV